MNKQTAVGAWVVTMAVPASALAFDISGPSAARFGQPHANQSGQIAFVYNSGKKGADDSIVRLDPGGTLTVIAEAGEGEEFSSFNPHLAINEGGEVAFVASQGEDLTPVPGGNTVGVFSGDGTFLDTIAITPSSAFAYPGSGCGDYPVSINDEDMVLFSVSNATTHRPELWGNTAGSNGLKLGTFQFSTGPCTGWLNDDGRVLATGDDHIRRREWGSLPFTTVVQSGPGGPGPFWPQHLVANEDRIAFVAYAGTPARPHVFTVKHYGGAAKSPTVEAGCEYNNITDISLSQKRILLKGHTNQYGMGIYDASQCQPLYYVGGPFISNKIVDIDISREAFSDPVGDEMVAWVRLDDGKQGIFRSVWPSEDVTDDP